jgi:hypothetical protein
MTEQILIVVKTFNEHILGIINVNISKEERELAIYNYAETLLKKLNITVVRNSVCPNCGSKDIEEIEQIKLF